jgi:hypothetical protein
MLGKKHSKEGGLVRAAIITLAASRVVGLVILGARALRHLIASKRAAEAGSSARHRFEVYADLEEAREQARARRMRRHLTGAEAT